MKLTYELLTRMPEADRNRMYDWAFLVAAGGALLALLTFTGCVGYVDGGGGGGVVVAEPELWLFGGDYHDHDDHGYNAHGYSHRGASSRSMAHDGGHGGRR